jgi:hypothetical protein
MLPENRRAEYVSRRQVGGRDSDSMPRPTTEAGIELGWTRLGSGPSERAWLQAHSQALRNYG